MGMTISKDDIIRVPVASQWISDALDYALLSWSQTYNRLGSNNPYKRIEKILIGKVSEDAVIAALDSNEIAYDVRGRTEWYKIDQYDLGIGQHDIDVKSNFLDIGSKYITKKYGDQSLDSKLNWFIDCHALVPTDQVASKRGSRKKRFLFVFMEGHFPSMSKLLPEANIAWVHMFWDYRWLKKAEHKQSRSAGRLRIGYDSDLPNQSITIFGTKREKKELIETVILKNGEVLSNSSFHQVFSIKFNGSCPAGTLRIGSDNLNLIEVIKPSVGFEIASKNPTNPVVRNDWHGVKIEQPVAFLLGWDDDDNFRLDGTLFKRFSKDVEQYEEIKIDNFGKRISELNPISKLRLHS